MVPTLLVATSTTGQDHLSEERATPADVQDGRGTVAVRPEADHGSAVIRRLAHDRPQQERAQDAAGELGDPVLDRLDQVDPARH
jgi:hypothetical protein